MKNAWIFLLLVICIVGLLSIPGAFPLLFLIFPLVFYVFRGKRIGKRFLISIGVTSTSIILVFINSFFVEQFYMLLISVFYFTTLLSTDFVIIHKITTIEKGAIPIIFCYVLITRILLSLNPWFFPFYWTLFMHLLPGTGIVTRVLLPIFLEAYMVVLAVVIYMIYTKQAGKSIYLQLFALALICCCVSPIVRQVFFPKKQDINLTYGFIQGSFSKHDYDLAEKYPALARKISLAYRRHIENSKPCRILIIPESAFPEKQENPTPPERTGHMAETLVQWLENISIKKNSYILTNISIENNGNIYNAAVLFNPKGILQDTYVKKNATPIYESHYFTTDNYLNTFEIDNYTVAPLICFDTVFFLNYFRIKQPALYIAISNDVFAEGTVLSRLHQSYGVMNARTIGLPFIQVTQNGPSFYVNSKGTLYSLAEPYEKTIDVTFTIR
jgi:apolipoprotein N-acyltransferase